MSSKTKRIFICIFVTLCMFLCISCVKNNKQKIDNNRIKIMTTIFPIYDITREIVKGIDNVSLEYLIDTGIDLHSFSPTSKDMVNISNSDLFIYIGGESDKWVQDVLGSLNTDKVKVLNLMDKMKDNLKEEELKEGMEDTEEEHEHEHGDEDEVEYDEHIWLSLRNAEMITMHISDALMSLYETDDIKTQILNNKNDYIKRLQDMDNQHKDVFTNAKENNKDTTLIFADRFPFIYFVNDYGIDYYAAFKGCSAESEASFKTIVFLADKLNELDLNGLFVLESNDKKIASTVIETSNRKNVRILELDSMQGKIENDKTSYISIMSDNLKVLIDYFDGAFDK